MEAARVADAQLTSRIWLSVVVTRGLRRDQQGRMDSLARLVSLLKFSTDVLTDVLTDDLTEALTDTRRHPPGKHFIQNRKMALLKTVNRVACSSLRLSPRLT